MAKLMALSMNTFREAIRNKILYLLLFFALGMMGVSVLLDAVTLGVQAKIIKDAGLAGINFFGVLVAIFVGIGLIYKEVERKTIYTLVSKPIHRYEVLLGKYLGILQTLLVEVVVMSALFCALLVFYGGGIDGRLFLAIGLIFLELMVITAVALFFSSFSTPILSGMLTLCVYVIGHLTGDLRAFGLIAGDEMLRRITEVLYYVLPNFENFNFKAQALYSLPISPSEVGFSVLYALMYVFLLLLSSSVIFERRNF